MARYRSGIDRATGRLLTGWAHVEQSIGVILTTQLEARIMRLDFGAELVRQIGRQLSADRVLQIYRFAVVAIHRWEPEYRIRSLSLVRVERTGALALGTRGTYYPEGRFGNYAIAEPANGSFALTAADRGVA